MWLMPLSFLFRCKNSRKSYHPLFSTIFQWIPFGSLSEKIIGYLGLPAAACHNSHRNRKSDKKEQFYSIFNVKKGFALEIKINLKKEKYRHKHKFSWSRNICSILFFFCCARKENDFLLPSWLVLQAKRKSASAPSFCLWLFLVIMAAIQMRWGGKSLLAKSLKTFPVHLRRLARDHENHAHTARARIFSFKKRAFPSFYCFSLMTHQDSEPLIYLLVQLWSTTAPKDRQALHILWKKSLI